VNHLHASHHSQHSLPLVLKAFSRSHRRDRDCLSILSKRRTAALRLIADLRSWLCRCR
jgi:hypothetical protein